MMPFPFYLNISLARVCNIWTRVSQSVSKGNQGSLWLVPSKVKSFLYSDFYRNILIAVRTLRYVSYPLLAFKDNWNAKSARFILAMLMVLRDQILRSILLVFSLFCNELGPWFLLNDIRRQPCQGWYISIQIEPKKVEGVLLLFSFRQAFSPRDFLTSKPFLELLKLQLLDF